MKRFSTILFLFSFLVFSKITAQNNGNPFELIPRLKQSNLKPKDTTSTVAKNPFDIVAANKTASTPKKKPVVKKKPSKQSDSFKITSNSAITKDRSFRTFLLFAILLSLVILTLLITFFRPNFIKASRALLNDNILNQLYREKESGAALPYYILYGMFFFNSGIFLFLFLTHNGLSIANTHFTTLLFGVFGVFGLFISKHILLSLLGFIFPISKEIRIYSFAIMIFSIIIGLILLPINLFLAYGPESLTKFVFYLSFAAIGIIYLLRSLRGLFIANKFFLFHKFHFLLYICTVEIAPVLVMIKLITSQF